MDLVGLHSTERQLPGRQKAGRTQLDWPQLLVTFGTGGWRPLQNLPGILLTEPV